ncbi:MAG: phosphonate ABC transporter, permease protein PhnE, partial [Rhizobiaceae bacterium]
MPSVPAINASDRERLRETYPQVFQRSFLQRYGLVIGSGLILAYLVACFFAFNVGPAFRNGQWDRASLYLQDWYSWRAQPRLRFQDDGTVKPQWSSRGQYAEGSDISWLKPTEGGGYRVTYGSDADRLDVTPGRVDVYLNGTVYPVTIDSNAATAPADAPSALRQDGAKVLVDYGFEGQAEIRPAQVYVQRRFLG